MPHSLIEHAKDLTFALIQTGSILPEDVQATLRRTHKTLTALKAQEQTGVPTADAVGETPPADWRKSISKYSITCLECGYAFKQLSIRHLGQHGLDTRSYRRKYGIPRSQPLAARSTTDRRRQVVRQTRPWEKASTYRKGQGRNGHKAPEPEAETVLEETEAPIAKAPAQPKRQRKTTPKKTARKTRSAG